MMDIHHELIHACSPEPCDDVVEQSLPGKRGQSLGGIVSERLEPGSQTGRKNHCLHIPYNVFSIFCSLWMSFTLMSNLLARWEARCSAQYTERCWPPVQPKQTWRLVNFLSMKRLT